MCPVHNETVSRLAVIKLNCLKWSAVSPVLMHSSESGYDWWTSHPFHISAMNGNNALITLNNQIIHSTINRCRRADMRLCTARILPGAMLHIYGLITRLWSVCIITIWKTWTYIFEVLKQTKTMHYR